MSGRQARWESLKERTPDEVALLLREVKSELADTQARVAALEAKASRIAALGGTAGSAVVALLSASSLGWGSWLTLLTLVGGTLIMTSWALKAIRVQKGRFRSPRRDLLPVGDDWDDARWYTARRLSDLYERVEAFDATGDAKAAYIKQAELALVGTLWTAGTLALATSLAGS